MLLSSNGCQMTAEAAARLRSLGRTCWQWPSEERPVGPHIWDALQAFPFRGLELI